VVGAGVKVDHVVSLGIGKSAGNGDRAAAGIEVSITQLGNALPIERPRHCPPPPIRRTPYAASLTSLLVVHKDGANGILSALLWKEGRS
jgi:hypothetical protein